MADYYRKALDTHKKLKGKLEVKSKIQIRTKEELSVAYTPGVAAVSRLLAQSPEMARDYTIKGTIVAVVSDGSAVLGLGNIGPLGALPVMEGKAVLFKEFADVDAVPIVLNTQDPDEIIKIVESIAPTFAGINLEDIAAPKCFYIEDELKKRLDIPVFHDDQHGTAIVTLAGLINALKVVNKKPDQIKVVISGAGAAGIAIAKLLKQFGITHIVLTDSKGVINTTRANLPRHKSEILEFIGYDPKDVQSLPDALKGADVFIGVSKGGIVTPEMVRSMANDPIIMAMANPEPEIMPDLAKQAGAAVVATGRSDFPNQINNVLAFPGVFRGAIDNKVTQITDQMKLNAAKALAKLVEHPSADYIVPSVFNKRVVKAIAEAVR